MRRLADGAWLVPHAPYLRMLTVGESELTGMRAWRLAQRAPGLQTLHLM
jgi:hypothetical protein